MSDRHWNPEVIRARLDEAADVLGRLPERHAPQLCSTWPSLAGGSARSGRPAVPPPEAIDRMDEALRWLAWLEHTEREVVWQRAEGMPWKRITHRLGIGRTTAWQRWRTALLKISVQLNAAAEQKRPNNKVVNKEARDAV